MMCSTSTQITNSDASPRFENPAERKMKPPDALASVHLKGRFLPFPATSKRRDPRNTGRARPVCPTPIRWRLSTYGTNTGCCGVGDGGGRRDRARRQPEPWQPRQWCRCREVVSMRIPLGSPSKAAKSCSPSSRVSMRPNSSLNTCLTPSILLPTSGSRSQRATPIAIDEIGRTHCRGPLKPRRDLLPGRRGQRPQARAYTSPIQRAPSPSACGGARQSLLDCRASTTRRRVPFFFETTKRPTRQRIRCRDETGQIS